MPLLTRSQATKIRKNTQEEEFSEPDQIFPETDSEASIETVVRSPRAPTHNMASAQLKDTLPELPEDASEAASLARTKAARLSIKINGKIDIMHRLFDMSDTMVSISVLDEKFKLIEELLDALEEAVDTLAIEAPTLKKELDDFFDTTVEHVNRTEGLCTAVKVAQEAKETRMRAIQEPAAPKVQPNLPPLPVLPVPSYDGDPLKWEEWYTAFSSLVDSTGLDDCVKHRYLSSVLSGAAKTAISGFALDGKHYSDAMEKLQKRCGRKKIILMKALARINQLPTIKKPDEKTLKNFVADVESAMNAIKGQGVVLGTCSVILVPLLAMKLEGDFAERWSEETDENDDIHVDDYIEFLHKRLRIVERPMEKVSSATKPPTTSNTSGSRPRSSPSAPKPSTASALTTTMSETSSGGNCSFDGCNKATRNCEAYLALSSAKKWSFAKAKKLCFRCLASNCPQGDACTLRGVCRECGRREHHTSLHFDAIGQPPAPVAEAVQASTVVAAVTNKKMARPRAAPSDSVSLLPTLQCRVQTSNGANVVVRALLDSGSQKIFISKHLALKLGPPIEKTNIALGRFGGQVERSKTHNVYSIGIGPTNYSFNAMWLKAIQVDHITPSIAPLDFANGDWSHLNRLQLADPDFNSDKPIDLLLDASFLANILDGSRTFGPAGTPVALGTRFGAVLTGGIVFGDSPEDVQALPTSGTIQSLSVICCHASFDARLQKLWEVDHCPERFDATFSQEEREAHKYFEATTEYIRGDSPHFEMKLPFKMDPTDALGSSLTPAKKRYASLRRKLEHDASLREAYAENLNGYLDLGHMEQVPEEEIDRPAYYVPHHCVVKLSSSTTPHRVVFDASCKSDSGYSLNDVLLNGPKYQDDLIVILTRWRSYKIAVNCDITKMYRSVWLPHDQRDWLRLLWHPELDKEPLHFRMTRLTFGVKPCGSMSVFCL